MKENNVICTRYCTYSGHCPHQAIDGKGTPAPLPAPIHVAELALEVGAPHFGRAINQLQELAQRGYIDFPCYTYSVSYDDENYPTWHCKCNLRGWDSSCMSFPSKRLAKHAAAFKMLCRVLAF